MCPNRREGVCTGFPGQAPFLYTENSVSYAPKAARRKYEYCNKIFIQRKAWKGKDCRRKRRKYRRIFEKWKYSRRKRANDMVGFWKMGNIPVEKK